ncbi:carbohydrate binding protein [Bacillus oleivorans]|uniref:Carbohydrate binding protein n=1 Tax=Bacillus oleivorans TaxID=1448271 RepID=A0A285D5U2_9BACI|nr:hypothetical protein [Bacillus oleivorans]SNX75191.1 carbohydrate binding protein [Bacillus oleivorans]
MKKKHFSAKLAILVTCFALLFSAGIPTAATSKHSGSIQMTELLTNTYYGEPQPLLTPLDSAVSIFNGAVGIEDGHHVMYTTTRGTPAKLNVVDLDDYKLLRVIDLVGTENTWAHKVTVDGDLYIATIGGGAKLWRYSPDTKQASIVAAFQGESNPFSITSDPEGNVYVGTYPGGKVFQYNPETQEVTDYGQMNPGITQEYIRSIAYVDGNIYAGTGHSKIIKYNIETGEKTDIAASLGEPGHVYDLDQIDNRYLFARYELSSNGYIYDTVSEQWLDTVIPNVRGLHVEEESLNGNVYYMDGNQFKYFNLETLEIHDTGMRYHSGLRGADWVEFNDPELPGKSLVTINFSGSVYIFNIETKKVIGLPSVVKGTAATISQVEKGPDGNLYISGDQTSLGAIYNPDDSSTKSFALGQGDSMSALGDKMLIGVYPDGKVVEFDTTQEPSSTNPKDLFVLGEEQNRVVNIHTADGKAFIGSVPFYGELGGALTIYDPKAEGEKYMVYRNVVEDQSVVSLAYKDGLVFGSTTINGGLGVDPTAGEAKIFVWDVINEQKVNEVTLEIPGLEKPQTIGDLSFGPDGLLWGAANNMIFAMNPDTLEVVKCKKIYPDGTLYYSPWQTVNLKWSNGILYANFDENLTSINPQTLESKKITQFVYSFTFGDDGDIYYALGSNRTFLYKIEVTSFTLMLSLIESYQKSNEIGQPLATQLLNKLNQTEHHLKDGKREQAVRQMHDFVKHLNHEDMAQFISERAKQILNSKAENLIEILTAEGEPPMQVLPLTNPSFEEPVANEHIPGWTSIFNETDNYYKEVTNQQSLTGDYSLKITDKVRNASVAVVSDATVIEAGAEYTASAHVFVEEGEGSLMLRFYDENYSQLSEHSLPFKVMLGQWEEVQIKGTAPENAKYARIYAYITSYQTGTVYYDDISLEKPI